MAVIEAFHEKLGECAHVCRSFIPRIYSVQKIVLDTAHNTIYIVTEEVLHVSV